MSCAVLLFVVSIRGGVLMCVLLLHLHYIQLLFLRHHIVDVWLEPWIRLYDLLPNRTLSGRFDL